jgi:hypothetical protein
VSIETNQPDSGDPPPKVFPYYIDDGTHETSDGSQLKIIATSSTGILYITDKGISFSLDRDPIKAAESFGSHIRHRSVRGHISGIDLASPFPLRISRSDLQVPESIEREMTRGLRFGGVTYIIIKNVERLEALLEPFPLIEEKEHQP